MDILLIVNILLIVIIAVLIDIIFGELPSKIHPVVLMGKFIEFFKGFLIKHDSKMSGMLLTLILTIIFAFFTYIIVEISKINFFIFILSSSMILSTTFAIKELLRSAEIVKDDIKQDIEKAMISVSYLVSRDTSRLSKEGLVSAMVESLTENIVDSVVSPIFYAFIFGVVGAVVYRVINTLDSMVGYKNSENINIGWFPAKLDDLVNYIPARITGLLIVIAAMFLHLNWRKAYKIMKRDGGKTPSPNSGYPMAAAAGALDIKLKKNGYYELGDDLNPLTTDKISEALIISKYTIILFLVFSFIILGLLAALLTYFSS